MLRQEEVCIRVEALSASPIAFVGWQVREKPIQDARPRLLSTEVWSPTPHGAAQVVEVAFEKGVRFTVSANGTLPLVERDRQ